MEMLDTPQRNEATVKILIAEDDPTSCRVLAAVLAKWGYEVVVTVDGQEAWEELQKPDPPRLAILDRMMPRMDGAELCRRIRQKDSDAATYIIMLTALGENEHIVSGLDAGADDYMVKPCNNDELHARIKAGRRILELQTTLSNRVQELQEALEHVKVLQGILPICMHCHKIRDDEESWHQVERYVENHSEARFSHSLCPECLEKYYPGTREE